MPDNVCTCFYCTSYLIDCCYYEKCKFCNCPDENQHTKDCICTKRYCHCKNCKRVLIQQHTLKCNDLNCCYSGLLVKNNHKHVKKAKLIICNYKNCFSYQNKYKVWSDSHFCFNSCENKECKYYKLNHPIH